MILDNLLLEPVGSIADRVELSAQVAMYRMMVENVADLIIRFDRSMQRGYVSPAVRDMLGYEPAELLGRSGFELIHPDDRQQVQALVRRLGAAHPVLGMVFRIRRKDGREIWVEARYRYLPEDGGVLAVVRDITARKTAEDLLAEANDRLADKNLILRTLADRDGLTGLANRRCFDAQFAKEFRRAVRQGMQLGLVLLDVDFFKRFNDRYGHLAGDDCLRRLCEAVQRALHRPGDQAARYGGEEIAVLLPETDEVGATVIAEQIRKAIVDLDIPHLDGVRGIVTASAGVCAIVPLDGDRPLEMVAAADRALYQAKKAGRDRVRACLPLRSPRSAMTGGEIAAAPDHASE